MKMLLRIWYYNGNYEEKIVTPEMQLNGIQIGRDDIESMIIDFVC